MRQKGYGDLVLSLRFERLGSAVHLDWEYNLDVMARMLLKEGISRFVPSMISIAYAWHAQPLSDPVGD